MASLTGQEKTLVLVRTTLPRQAYQEAHVAQTHAAWLAGKGWPNEHVLALLVTYALIWLLPEAATRVLSDFLEGELNERLDPWGRR